MEQDSRVLLMEERCIRGRLSGAAGKHRARFEWDPDEAMSGFQ